jgi:hypothetical protein
MAAALFRSRGDYRITYDKAVFPAVSPTVYSAHLQRVREAMRAPQTLRYS